MSILRPYQRQGVAAFWDALSPEVNRVAIEMATGLGKTITFAGAIDEYLATRKRVGTPYRRALVLVHTDELVRQAVEKIQVVTRGRWSVGVVKAARNEVDADIVVASVATLRQPGRREQITDVGLIVVDECHHTVAKTYLDILAFYGAIYPAEGSKFVKDHPEVRRTPVLGVTATLARSDRQGLGQVFQEMPFSRSLVWGIRKGFLIDLIPWSISIPDLDPYAPNAELDGQLVESIAPEAVVQAWIERVVTPSETGSLSTVLFAPLVKSAQAFSDAFNAAGVKAEVVHGAMPEAERAAVLERYEAGTTTVVCNAMVLTEGWDSPRTMCVIIARPTQSVPLFVQMIGRGARPWLAAEAPPREDQMCTVLVVAGAVTDLQIVADLSENPGEVTEGRSLLEMADEWDLGKGLPEDEDTAYRGPVKVEQWDALIQRSSKAWKYTEAGVPYLPTRKRSEGYVFIVERAGRWQVWHRLLLGSGLTSRVFKVAEAPDLELAMAVAEDEAQEAGGDIGALLADKGRAWRKGMPSAAQYTMALRLGLEKDIDRIRASKASGKAGKLSDLIDKVQASKVLDPVVTKIKERGERNA